MKAVHWWGHHRIFAEFFFAKKNSQKFSQLCAYSRPPVLDIKTADVFCTCV